MVGHFLLKFIDYQILGDHAPDVACRCPSCCTGEERQQWSRSWPFTVRAIVSSGQTATPYYNYIFVRDDGSYQNQRADDYYLVGDDGRITQGKGPSPY
jgi:hypothetical protein